MSYRPLRASTGSSIRPPERFGLHHIGRVPEVGAKFGRWLDPTIMRLPLT
ncbi:hypothetical protein OHB41_45955 [Streptomyces sp. NBC_01571]|nr:hypothetical protein [Streptomyces sp. NBC_01571]MCX4580379.1 hypothetical protein [Streptomyces sp. NBC_01571]